MVNNIIKKGKSIFISPQSSILSAATIIMLMIVASRVLGLVRTRTLAQFFTPEDISLFFAAFRLPDTIFEVLVFGTFSSAFIPVFTKAIDKDKSDAWRLASTISNIGFLSFIVLSTLLIIFADRFYGFIAPGYTGVQRDQIVQLSKVLFAAQGFFVLSYVLTGVLESMRRFLVPALAPLFYNLGIIFGIVFLSERYGLMGPAIGVFIGAMSHFLIQLPLAIKLGYRLSPRIKIDKNVKKIGRLAAPRVLELTFVQMVKSVELYLASFIATASYAYYYLGNTLQLLPVGLFGISVAKAALPTLAKQADNPEEFKKSLWSSLHQIIFLVVPFATILAILRIPIIRLVYGTQIFDWESTVQTGKVLSAFAFGITFQAVIALMVRAFYALHDTKTPVIISIFGIILVVVLNFIFIRGLNLPVWGLAASFTIGATLQAIALFYLMNRRLGGKTSVLLKPVVKAALAASGSGVVMYFILKFFDRSVWIKRLSFIGKSEIYKNIPFENFVLDTRYTGNLLILTIGVSTIGLLIYLGISIILKSKEVWIFFNLLKRIFAKRRLAPIPAKEQEPIAPSPTDTGV